MADLPTPASAWFVFREGKVLLDAALDPPRWTAHEAARAGIGPGATYFLGPSEAPYGFAAEMDALQPLPPGLQPVNPREAITQKDDAYFHALSRASQLVTWATTHRYCGQCGAKTQPVPDAHAFKCPACGLEAFPRVSPAVIVAVLRGDEILLARARRFPPGLYSVLAGFVEAGESLEECVHREIHEECGVAVDDLRYFGSQSWPFPHSLMVAFVARYAGGEVIADPKELQDAGWFRRDNLPDLPLRVSIARSMIEWYRAGAVQEVSGWRPRSS